jgi:cytoskeleton protein RodZ
VPVTPAPQVETPPKPEVPPPPPLTPDMPQSKITMEFTADCWVDVVDAAGRPLAYELSTAGRTLTVRGEAPFKVFFGYSPGVQVYFNDQLFDHRPFQRRETARFRLGTPEDNVLLTEAQ